MKRLKLETYFFLQSLDISRNQLTGFEEDFATKLLNIDDVIFEKNPLVCDICHIGAILNRIENVRKLYLFLKINL